LSIRIPSMKPIWGEEKKRRRKLAKSMRYAVWNMYIGADRAEGKCWVCKKTINQQDFEVGHNKAKSKGGSDNTYNLRPICRNCNRAMGTMSIEAYKKHFKKPKIKKAHKKRKRRQKSPVEKLLFG
jgi:5-methylcytosine-specific restriction endonuclease McrA